MNNEGDVLVATASEEHGECVHHHCDYHGNHADHRRPRCSIHPAADLGEDQEAGYPDSCKAHGEYEKDKHCGIGERSGHTFSPLSFSAMAIVPA